MQEPPLIVSDKNVVALFLPFTSLNYFQNNLKIPPALPELTAVRQHPVLHLT